MPTGRANSRRDNFAGGMTPRIDEAFAKVGVPASAARTEPILSRTRLDASVFPAIVNVARRLAMKIFWTGLRDSAERSTRDSAFIAEDSSRIRRDVWPRRSATLPARFLSISRFRDLSAAPRTPLTSCPKSSADGLLERTPRVPASPNNFIARSIYWTNEICAGGCHRRFARSTIPIAFATRAPSRPMPDSRSSAPSARMEPESRFVAGFFTMVDCVAI